MSPKKSAKNPTAKRKITENVPKRTVKKQKPKLNMPANIQVSIPFTRKSIGTTEMSCHGRPRYKKNLDFNTKLALANEVARKQLVKEESHPFEPENDTKNTKKGRTKKVKLISDFFQNRIIIGNTNTEAVITSTATKTPEKNEPKVKPTPTRRIVTRKRLADSTVQHPAKVPKIEPDTETESISAKIKLEEPPNCNPPELPPPIVIGPLPIILQPLSVIQPEPCPQPPTTPIQPQPVKPTPATKRKPIVRQPRATMKPTVRRKRALKGKKGIEALGDKSPQKLPEKATESKVQQVPPNKPGPVDSRKNSISSNSNLSWTKDISSSSTTTCITVCSNDFVRFNKKLPVIKLTHIDRELMKRKDDVKETADMHKEDDDSSDSSDSDSIDNEHKFSENLDSLEVNSLHLSVSSPPSSRLSQNRSKENSPDYAKAAEKLTMTIKKIDMEIINWINSGNEDFNANLATFKEKMFDVLDNEFGVITHCRRLKEILDPPRMEDRIEETLPEVVKEANVKEIENNDVVEINKEVDFVKPRPYRKLSNISEGNANSNPTNEDARDDSSDDENPASGINHYPYYDHHDDDDALSLFAESITGIESSRINTSIASVSNARQVEEYVPKPLNEDLPHADKQTYCPTKIRETGEIISSKVKTVCEKQTADSTCIYKQSNSNDDAESYQDFNEHTELDTRIDPPDIVKPRLMESFFDVLPKRKSVVFGNVCFYNLINCCRKMFFGQCRFLHIVPDSAQVKAKLNLLDERMLIQEYLLMRNWAELRRKYGICFAEECANRGLTRILVEIAFDFIVKARNEEEDSKLRVNTIELTLLHLNNVDLSICEDLLKLTVYADQANRTLLCDVFMATMSITQNFSRFKLVFLNLTYFMVNNDRMFIKDVVEHILERICILPFEEPVAKALIQMMRLTKPEIFQNSMIGHFEKQISVNKDLFEDFLMLKRQCEFTSMLASSVMGSSPPRQLDQSLSVRPEGGDSHPPAPSPDTTNRDNMNKMGDESLKPVITRTIGMNPPIIFNRGQISPTTRAQISPASRAHDNPGPSRVYQSSGSSNSDDTIKLNVRKWRNRSIYPHIIQPHLTPERSMVLAPIRTPLRPMRPHNRPLQRMPFNQRLVTFRSPVNYVSRQPGPNY